MVTNETTSEHPVFRELTTILQLIDIQPNPEDWNFEKCPALATSTKSKCTKSTNNIAHARELYNHFRLVEKWPETDGFFNQLERFLIASHCKWHGPKAIESFEAWKKIRATTMPSDRPPTISDDNHSDTLMSLSTVATMQPMEPVLDEAERLESTSESNHKAHVHVETVTNGISTIDITATSQIKIINNHGSGNTAKAERIIGLGLANLQRKGSLRNDSPVFFEMHRPLTTTEREYGIVYVLEHTTHKGLFKIGWTRATAEDRLRQPGNCYASNAEILHQTLSGPFLAASKAEKLVQTVLRHHNLIIKVCERCGGGHREWFRARKEMVIETVEIMEAFVRLPAYELKDDKTWKLSDAAYEKIKTMCHFSPERLKSLMTPIEEPTEKPIERHSIEGPLEGISTQLKPEGAIHTTGAVVPPISQDSNQSIDEKNPSTASEAVKSGEGTKGGRRSLGTDFAKKGKKVAQLRDKIIDRFGQRWNLLREGMAELDSNDKTENIGTRNRSGSGANNVEDAIMGVLWSLLPEEIKSWEDDVDNKEARRNVSWTKIVKHDFRTFITDFKVEWKRESEESRDVPASQE